MGLNASKAAALANNNPPQAHLLGIPKELLNQIIIRAIPSPSYRIGRGFQVVALPPTPALARTCKTLEAIVLPMYYGQDTMALTFASATMATAWLWQNSHEEVREKEVRSITFPMIPRVGHRVRLNCKFSTFLRDGTDELGVMLTGPMGWRALCGRCVDRIGTKTKEINEWYGSLRDPDFTAGEKLLVFALWVSEVEKEYQNNRTDSFVGCYICGSRESLYFDALL